MPGAAEVVDDEPFPLGRDFIRDVLRGDPGFGRRRLLLEFGMGTDEERLAFAGSRVLSGRRT
ncbi:hypothetical protein QLH51_14680 [Sphingomonas sp. 2R-10]|uniref:hypothetical protein n=1 Tax=Sphingomonas sp. 2R-10 TaxID=3045148 RepID=UPI000F7B54E7|nr:hypothetical protein [Sphingomonas sp. 2R-10]MDJ0278042.1 hypothetical protein [Sphingomonas sp. 2R-10]